MVRSRAKEAIVVTQHDMCSLRPSPVLLQDDALKQTQVVRVHCWPMVVLFPAIPDVLPPPLLHSANAPSHFFPKLPCQVSQTREGCNAQGHELDVWSFLHEHILYISLALACSTKSACELANCRAADSSTCLLHQVHSSEVSHKYPADDGPSQGKWPGDPKLQAIVDVVQQHLQPVDSKLTAARGAQQAELPAWHHEGSRGSLFHLRTASMQQAALPCAPSASGTLHASG